MLGGGRIRYPSMYLGIAHFLISIFLNITWIIVKMYKQWVWDTGSQLRSVPDPLSRLKSFRRWRQCLCPSIWARNPASAGTLQNSQRGCLFTRTQRFGSSFRDWWQLSLFQRFPSAVCSCLPKARSQGRQSHPVPSSPDDGVHWETFFPLKQYTLLYSIIHPNSAELKQGHGICFGKVLQVTLLVS